MREYPVSWAHVRDLGAGTWNSRIMLRTIESRWHGDKRDHVCACGRLLCSSRVLAARCTRGFDVLRLDVSKSMAAKFSHTADCATPRPKHPQCQSHSER